MKHDGFYRPFLVRPSRASGQARLRLQERPGGAELLAAGLHDELLAQLSKIAGMDVIARTSVMQYAGTEKTVSQVGNELGAQHVLEGGLLRAGDLVRLNVQPIASRLLSAPIYRGGLCNGHEVSAIGHVLAARRPCRTGRLAPNSRGGRRPTPTSESEQRGDMVEPLKHGAHAQICPPGSRSHNPSAVSGITRLRRSRRDRGL